MIINPEVNFRRKNFHEAADTGILLWRENFIYFLPLYAIPLWICAFSLRLFLPEKLQIYSWLIIWFLKPLFDRIALHIISIRFFERDANIKRITGGLWKTIFRGLIGDLSWRRFNPLRSTAMPMLVLEKNLKPGKLTSKRKNQLKNGGINYGFFLTLWGIFIEAALLLGIYLFFLSINELMLGGRINMFDLPYIEIYLFAAWCLNLMLIETIYVCMGFSLYINSRITVEGWDLEILFRDFAEKIKEKSKNILAIILFAFFITIPSLSPAEEMPPDAYKKLQTVLESPDFGGEKASWDIRLKKESNKNKNDNIFKFDFDFDFNKIREYFASSLRIILVCSIAALLIFLIICLYKIKLNKNKKTSGLSPGIIDSKAAEDPKILLEKALKFYKNGDIRLAWGYCTAAAIQSWQIYREIIFPPNATENECSNIVNQKAANKAEAGAFCKLIKNWVYFVYAGRLPSEENFNEAVNFCVLIRNENGK